MDRSKIIARFSLLPLRHKVAAGCVAAAIAAGGVLISSTAPRRYESTAVLSYDKQEMKMLTKAQPKSGERSVAHVVTAILSEDAGTGKAAASAENHAGGVGAKAAQAHLEVAEEQGSVIRLRWTGEDAVETAMAAQRMTRQLTRWSPSADGLMQGSDEGGAQAPRNSAGGEPARQASEETLLRATLAVLETQLKGLNEELRAHGGEPDGRGRMKSASLLLGEKSDDGTSERSQLEKKISNLHKQQTLILARLKETEREARSRPRPELPLQAAAVSPSETRTALKAADAGVPMAPHAAFVLVEPATAPRLASDWRASAERQGFMLALLGGALYLAIALWRFRPIHGLQALEALLPKEVIFVGGIPEAHK